jgi:uncharacterized protein
MGRAIVHIEIPAENREELARFYAEMFGWKFTHLSGMNYTMFETGNIGGGMPEIDGKMYQGDDVLVYVSSDDIDADLKQAVALGGKKVMGKTEIPGYGQFAIFTDPTGSRIALWKSSK